MTLADDLDPLSYDAAYWLQALEEPDYPLDDLGDVCIDLEQKLRAIGIIRLLTDADTDGYLHNLIRAGKTWCHFLSRCRAEPGGTDDHHFCAGRFEPLLDAIAARERGVRATLASLAPADFRDGHEYEADYAWGRALCELVSKTPDANATTAHLERCGATGDEMSAARAEVGKALLAKDQAAFDEAFDTLIACRRREIDAEDERGKAPELVTAPTRAVFVEGLALLILAEEGGIATRTDYPMCPSLARAPMRRPFPGR